MDESVKSDCSEQSDVVENVCEIGEKKAENFEHYFASQSFAALANTILESSQKFHVVSTLRKCDLFASVIHSEKVVQDGELFEVSEEMYGVNGTMSIV